MGIGRIGQIGQIGQRHTTGQGVFEHEHEYDFEYDDEDDGSCKSLTCGGEVA